MEAFSLLATDHGAMVARGERCQSSCPAMDAENCGMGLPDKMQPTTLSLETPSIGRNVYLAPYTKNTSMAEDVISPQTELLTLS